ncbi:MAG: putative selenate reductase subunit YgfK, partial [Eubacteriales bacterium]|nr:putative selenate reductase subunit YgfK [Eubacteriales bacterium]
LAKDEGYNCEWSTELTVPQAAEEYVKAWWILKILSRELELGSADGFVFNMSVGYSLEGIKSEKIDRFLRVLRGDEAYDVWTACREWCLENLRSFRHVDRAFIESVPRRVCDSVTISTLHGCPPQEIESIARYLIEEKGFHTFIKCNPTLLGYRFARDTLDALGYDYIQFGDFHFRDDLQYEDAVPMLRRLQALADEKHVQFGVKLTNTFPVDVKANELPSEEMYMSGRSLFPLSVELARRLSVEFEGKLRISYSGGVDIHSLARMCEAGIWPVTMATTLLRPGGYNRLAQLAEETVGTLKPFTGVDVEKLSALAADALKDPWYRKAIKPAPSRKLNEKVPLLDCFTAPCRGGCPIGQDIPAYIRLMGEGKTLEALRVIAERNPLPHITGTICPQFCAQKCTRLFYEDAVCVRNAKYAAAAAAFPALLAETAPAPLCGKKAAVVGGGPAGLSAAYFLARAGWEVTVYEREESLGGVVAHIIPEFRIAREAVKKDIALCRAMGVRFVMGHTVEDASVLEGHDAVILAVGAHAPGRLTLEYGETINALDFLRACKAGSSPVDGENVAVVGGGNTAMDAARAALRLPGVRRVSLVYRRTRRWMPADEEELAAALEDGVTFCELLAPIGVRDGVLRCREMALGEPDEKGRRSPVATDKTVDIPADTVIAAVGEKIDNALYRALGLALDDRGLPVVNSAGESSIPNVYLIGDGAGGPATVVEAIADASRAVQAITGLTADTYTALNRAGTDASARGKKGRFCTGGCPESERCLECATVCESCVDVCPNRANVSVQTGCGTQIVHVDCLCNECGNCATFCPYDSAPYRDKLTLYRTAEDMEGDTNNGFLPLPDGRWRIRLHGETGDYALKNGESPDADIAELILAFAEEYSEYIL